MWPWPLSDHLSSATRITDATGLEVRRLAYSAFGAEAENQGTGDEPKYTYTGKEKDSSGLYYYGARYDDPALSRFITADTVYDAGPQGLNRYAYALNNPIIYRDPTGHMTATDVADVVTLGGGSAAALWQAVKEGLVTLIPGPGVVAGGVLGAIPLILHAKNVGEGSDVIPLPTTPVGATPAEPDEESSPKSEEPKKPRPPSGDPLVEQIKEELEDSTSKQTSQKKYYLDPKFIKANSVFKDVTPGNPQITAGGQTLKGGQNPCLSNSRQIAAMRGYGTEEVGNLEDILNSSGPIKSGIYKVKLKTGNNHWVVVNADGTVTDVNLKLNLGEVPDASMKDTWERHDYYYNELGHKQDEIVKE